MRKNEKSREYYAEERRILRKAMLDKKLVVFVGAGVSLDSGMPSWSKAIKSIANKLNILDGSMEYLKIPQFYYNSRGKKEYVELMREIFRYNDDLNFSDIHRNIIKLNTHTIITTNYDCLLERAVAENSEFVQVISQDKDLPYRSVEKEIIKMHGDFLAGNFVLREEDYLHYSENFKLIEAYVKALIATNVILFIGYSFSDPDVKQIFTWVKDILEDDFQRAYMLEACKEYDIHEYDYYKNLGVNVLCAAEMYEDFDKRNASIYTSKFLEYILEEDSSENQIDEIYKRSKCYSELNYICNKYINRIFENCGIFIENGVLAPFNYKNTNSKEVIMVLFGNEKERDDDKIALIKSVINKSTVKLIRTEDSLNSIKPVEITIEHKPIFRFMIAVENFDFKELNAIREENEANLSEQSPELYLEQAYISYILFEYVKAYRYLRVCSKIYYKKKQYVWYFISEVNRKNIGRIIERDFRKNCSDEERNKIKTELAALNIEAIYRKLPLTEPDERDFLQDLYTFRTYYTLFQNAYLTSRKTEEEATTNYSMYAGVPSYLKFREQIKDCYYYDLYNYIMIDRYQEDIETYRLYARTLISSACCSDLSVEESEEEFFGAGNVYASCLEKFDVYVILRYMKLGELKKMLKDKCNDFLNVDDETRSYLQSIVSNLSEIKNMECDYFWTYLVLAGYINLDSILVTNTLQELEKHLNDYNIRTHYNELMRFIWWSNKQNLISMENCNILGNFIEKLVLGIASTGMQYYYQELLTQCLVIYKDVKEAYFSDTLLALSKKNQYSVLLRIYPFCSESIQCEIQKAASEWNWNEDYKQVNIYEGLVLNKLFKVSEKIEKGIIKKIEDLKIKSKGSSPNLYEQVVSSLTNLYINDKIHMKDEVKKTILNSGIPVYIWLVSAEEYDYETFNVAWLNYCSNELLKTIATFPSAKEGIMKKVKSAYINANIDKTTLKKFFEYFIDG